MTKIILDPGHGGTDPGAVGKSLKEKDVVLNIAKKVKAYLEKNYEVEVLLTRNDDRYLSLPHRTYWANKQGANCLVSIHINAAGSTGAQGYEDFVFTTDGATSKSVALQKSIHKHLSKVWTDKKRTNRGMKKANLHMVREYKGAAVLVELGFISNSVDHALLANSSFIESNVVALSKALAEYNKLKAKAKPKPAPKPVKKPETGTPVQSCKPVAKKPTSTKTSEKTQRLVKVIFTGSDGYLDARSTADYKGKTVEKAKKDEVFTIVKKVRAKNATGGLHPYMYQLKSGVYITANPKYVQELKK